MLSYVCDNFYFFFCLLLIFMSCFLIYFSSLFNLLGLSVNCVANNSSPVVFFYVLTFLAACEILVAW